MTRLRLVTTNVCRRCLADIDTECLRCGYRVPPPIAWSLLEKAPSPFDPVPEPIRFGRARPRYAARSPHEGSRVA